MSRDRFVERLLKGAPCTDPCVLVIGRVPGNELLERFDIDYVLTG